MKYEATISITYRVSVWSDLKMTNEQVIEHIMENEVITEHKLVEIDYDGAHIEEIEE